MANSKSTLTLKTFKRTDVSYSIGYDNAHSQTPRKYNNNFIIKEVKKPLTIEAEQQLMGNVYMFGGLNLKFAVGIPKIRLDIEIC